MDDLIGIFNSVPAADHADFITGPSVIGCLGRPFVPFYQVGDVKNIKVPDILWDAIRQGLDRIAVEKHGDFLIEITNGTDSHIADLQKSNMPKCGGTCCCMSNGGV